MPNTDWSSVHEKAKILETSESQLLSEVIVFSLQESYSLPVFSRCPPRPILVEPAY